MRLPLIFHLPGPVGQYPYLYQFSREKSRRYDSKDCNQQKALKLTRPWWGPEDPESIIHRNRLMGGS